MSRRKFRGRLFHTRGPAAVVLVNDTRIAQTLQSRQMTSNTVNFQSLLGRVQWKADVAHSLDLFDNVFHWMQKWLREIGITWPWRRTSDTLLIRYGRTLSPRARFQPKHLSVGKMRQSNLHTNVIINWDHCLKQWTPAAFYVGMR